MSRLIMILATVASVCSYSQVCRSAAPENRLYWTNNFGINRSNTDGSQITQLTYETAGYFALDAARNAIYYSNLDVGRYSFPGAAKTSLFDLPGSQTYVSVTLDLVHSHLYFIDVRASTIYRTDLNGSNPAVIIPGDGQNINITRIGDLEVDPIGGKLYWTFEKTFRRSNLDGSQQETLFSSNEWVLDFKLSPQSSQLYWTSSTSGPGGGTVNRANFDGTGRQTLVSGNLWGVYGLALDLEAGKMYFSDVWTSGPTAYDNTLRVANLDGSMPQTLINFGPSQLNAAYSLELGPVLVPEPPSAALAAVLATALIQRRRSWRRP
jgi:hypothetical protein